MGFYKRGSESVLKEEKGFTIVELMVIVVIIASFSGLFLFVLTGFVDYFRLRSEVREVYSLFLSARQRAIFHQEDHVIRFDVFKQQIILYSQQQGELEVHCLGDKSIELKQSNIIFGGNGEVNFKPVGTSGSGRVIFETKDHAFQIVVYGVTGRVRYESV